MPIFKLHGAYKGQTVNLGNANQYRFVNGLLACSIQDAEPLGRILCTYYSAELIRDESADVVAPIRSKVSPQSKTGKPAGKLATKLPASEINDSSLASLLS